MIYVPKRKVLTRQPVMGLAEVDFSNPINNGLIRAFDMSQGGIDLAFEQNAIDGSVAADANGEYLPESNTFCQAPSIAPLLTDAVTSLIVFDRKTSNGGSQILSGQSAFRTPATYDFGWFASSGGNLYWVVFDTAGTQYLATINSSFLGFHTWVATASHSGGLKTYIDAKPNGTGTFGGANNFRQSSNYIFALCSGSTVNAPGRLYLSMVWDRALSAAEIAQIGSNPWQLFKKRNLGIYYVSAGGASDLSGAAAIDATVTGDLKSDVAMSAASLATATATGVINQSLDLFGSTASIVIANGIATITTDFSGIAFNQAFADGLLNQSIGMGGSAGGSAGGSGNLDAGAGFEGAAAGSANSSATLNLFTSLSANSLIEALAAANLDGGAASDLTGNAGVQAASSGNLASDMALQVAASIIVTGSAGLTSEMPLVGAALSVAGVGGDLSVEYQGLSVNAVIQALAGGSIKMALSVDAAALARLSASASLSLGGGQVGMNRYIVNPLPRQFQVGTNGAARRWLC